MADPQQSAQPSRYVEMPNGSYLEWPEGVSADEFKAKASQFNTPPAEPDTRNRVQKAFDTLTTVTPEQEKGHNPVVNAAQKVGAGVMQLATPLVHPINSLEKAQDTLMHPHDTFSETVQGAKEHPWETAGNLLGGAVLGGAAGEVAPKVMAKIPSTSRAGAALSDIETKAANTPVNFTNTDPALQKFEQHVATGGKGADVMSKLGNRITPRAPTLAPLQQMQAELSGAQSSPMANPVNFPEARDFYQNISREARRPGPLRRAFEDPREPQFRYAAGPVREGLNADLTESLKPLNLDQDYAAALKEYAQGKALKTGLKRAGIAAGSAAAGAAGLGKIHGIASSVLR